MPDKSTIVERRKTTHGWSLRASKSRLRSALFLLPFSFLLLTSAQADGSWSRQRSGTLVWLKAVYFLDAETGWAAGGRGVVLRTNDGGVTWKTLALPTSDPLRDIFFADAQTGWLLCDKNAYAQQVKGEPSSYLLRTDNGGETWARVEPTGKDLEVRLVRLHFADASRGWVLGEAGALYATQDGGRTWARQRVPTRHLLLGGAFQGARQGWVVGAGGTLLHTTDGGTTWRSGYVEEPAAAVRPRIASAVASDTKQANGITSKQSPRLYAVSFANERRGWAVGARGRVYSTTNGGRTWRAQESGVESDLFDVKFFDEHEGWAAGAGGTLLHTTDGGARWNVVPSGTTHPLERLSFVNRARGWAVGLGGTIITYAPARSSAPRLKS